MSRLQANFLLLLAGAIWGMAFVAQSTAMDDVGPFQFVCFRFLVATLVVLPLALRETVGLRRMQGSPCTGRQLLQFACIGIALFAGMTLQQLGLLTTTVTNSGFLTGLYVVFTPLLGVAVFRDWPHRVVWPAALLSFFGVFLLSGSMPGGFVAGDLLTVGSAVCWALQVVLIARFVVDSARPFLLCFVQFAITSLLAGILALVFESFSAPAIARAAPEILYAGALGSGIAFTLQVIGQRYTGAAQAALFLSSEAPFAALAGAVLLGERISLTGLVGCTLIFAAMLAVETVPRIRSGKRVSARHLPHGKDELECG